jgi:hypothetical protein
MAGHRPKCLRCVEKGVTRPAPAAPGLTTCRRCAGDVATRERAIAVAQAEMYARRLGLIIDAEDPYEGYATALRMLRSAADAYGRAVIDLGPGGTRYTDDKGAEQIRGEVIVWQKTVRDLGDLSIAGIRAKLDERRIQIAELGGTVVVGLLEDMLDAALASVKASHGDDEAAVVRQAVIDAMPEILARHASAAARHAIAPPMSPDRGD